MRHHPHRGPHNGYFFVHSVRHKRTKPAPAIDLIAAGFVRHTMPDGSVQFHRYLRILADGSRVRFAPRIGGEL